MANFDVQHLSIMHVGATLFGTGEKFGLRYKKLPILSPAWPWQEYREEPDGALTEIARRSHEHLAALDLVAKKPRSRNEKAKGDKDAH